MLQAAIVIVPNDMDDGSRYRCVPGHALKRQDICCNEEEHRWPALERLSRNG